MYLMCTPFSFCLPMLSVFARLSDEDINTKTIDLLMLLLSQAMGTQSASKAHNERRAEQPEPWAKFIDSTQFVRHPSLCVARSGLEAKAHGMLGRLTH
jgi:hypothetical protein